MSYPDPRHVCRGIRFGPDDDLIGTGPDALEEPPAGIASTAVLTITVMINGRAPNAGETKATARLIEQGSVLTSDALASNTKDSALGDAAGVIQMTLFTEAAFDIGDGRYSIVVTHLGTPLYDQIVTIPAGVSRLQLAVYDRTRRYEADGQHVAHADVER